MGPSRSSGAQFSIELKEDDQATAALLGMEVSGRTEEEQTEMSARILSSLNAEQKEAVTASGAPLMIIASAGSGKTRTLTAKIAYDLNRGLRADQMLAVTFTRKAALEMKDRIQKTLGWNLAAGMLVCNFHQLCLRILRQYYVHLGFQQQFLVLGSSEQRKVVERCVERLMASNRLRPGAAGEAAVDAVGETDLAFEDDLIDESLGISAPGSSSGGVRGHHPGRTRSGKVSAKTVNLYLGLIRKAKAQGRHPSDCPPELASVFRLYVEELRSQSAIDFSDMIPLALHLFRARPDVLKLCQQKYRYIFVDEFQDVTPEQLELLQVLAQPTGGRHLTVCGDDDQSVSWGNKQWDGPECLFTDGFMGFSPFMCFVVVVFHRFMAGEGRLLNRSTSFVRCFRMPSVCISGRPTAARNRSFRRWMPSSSRTLTGMLG